MNENEILEHLRQVLVDEFDLDPKDIRPQARLYEDLEIDSIDAVDLIVQLKNLTGVRIPPEDFKNVRTVSDVTEVIRKLKG